MILDIDHIEEPKFDTEPFEYLVLDPGIKKTLRSLAMSNYRKKADKEKNRFSTDFIKGKGEGEVFLLHGPPGVGKTCAAGKPINLELITWSTF